jgi:hypothetical protein
MSEFEDFVAFNDLVEVYNGSGVSKDKKYRYVLFSKARTLDGEIRIYGPKFIGIKWQTAYRALPQNGWKVLRSVEDAKKFLDLAFVKHNFNEAINMK